MVKRHIRLKELGVDLDAIYTPAEAYLDKSPGLDRKEIYHVRTDSEGNQGSALNNQSRNKIYLVGDSTVESIYLRSSRRPQTLIEKYLLEDGYDVEVKNLGVSGSQLLHIVNLIINKLGDKSGATVVVSLPVNDVGPLRYVEGYYSRHKHYGSIIPADMTSVATREDYNFILYHRMLNLLASVCRTLGLKLLLTSVCHKGGIERFERLNREARNFVCEQHVPFLDLEQEQAVGVGFFYDDAHFLAPGSEHYARHVAEALKGHLRRSKQKSFQAFKIDLQSPSVGATGFWTPMIDIRDAIRVRASIDFAQTGESENGAVLLVKYDHEPVFLKNRNRMSMAGGNPDYHLFQYLNCTPDKRIEKIYDIPVPDGGGAMSVGIKGWRRNNIEVREAVISVISGHSL